MTWQDTIAAITNDRVSGAADITVQTGKAFCQLCRNETFADHDTLMNMLEQLIQVLVSGQPEMASVTVLCNVVLFAADEVDDHKVTCQHIIAQVEAFLEHMQNARQTVARKAQAFLPDEVVVLSYSISSTVLAAMRLAAESGRRLNIRCLESRPLYEGRDLARQLVEMGHAVSFSIDASAYSRLEGCDLVLMGADSLTTDGVMNKVGTAAISVCARTRGVPVYMLCDTNKIWPDQLGSNLYTEHPVEEVWEGAPPDVDVVNSYFDLTPWEALAGVITEDGFLSAQQVRQISRAKPVHPTLKHVVAQARSLL